MASIWQHAAGRLTYDGEAPATDARHDIRPRVVDQGHRDGSPADAAGRGRRLLLSTPVRTLVPDWRGQDRHDVTVIDLLEHCAGLTAWWDLYKRNHSAREFAHEIGELPLEYRPRTRSIYSDLGFPAAGIHRRRARRSVRSTRSSTRCWATRGCCSGHRADRRRRSRPRKTTRPGAGGCWSARCTTRTPPSSAASRDTRGCSARRRPWAPMHASCSRLFGSPTRLGPPWLQRRFLQKSAVPRSSRALAWDTMLPTSSCGTRLSRGGVRAHGVHGHVAVDRSAARSLCGAAHEPRASDAPGRSRRRAAPPAPAGARRRGRGACGLRPADVDGADVYEWRYAGERRDVTPCAAAARAEPTHAGPAPGPGAGRAWRPGLPPGVCAPPGVVGWPPGFQGT